MKKYFPKYPGRWELHECGINSDIEKKLHTLIYDTQDAFTKGIETLIEESNSALAKETSKYIQGLMFAYLLSTLKKTYAVYFQPNDLDKEFKAIWEASYCKKGHK